jgi:hypothetical protein
MADTTLRNEPQPDEMPDVYASICSGQCLEPIFADGAYLVFDKHQEPENGDFVGFWLRPDCLAPGEHPLRVKRLVSGLPESSGFSLPYERRPGDEVEPLIILEQLNPPRRFYVAASKILAMHRLIGEAEPDGSGHALMVRQMIGGQMMRCIPED